MLERRRLTPLEPDAMAALKQKQQESEAFVEVLLATDWVPNEKDQNTLMHPRDNDLSICHRPSGELLLSPKLLERIKQDAERERAAGRALK